MIHKGAIVLLGLGLAGLGACGVGGDDAPPPDDKPLSLCKAHGTTAGTWTQGQADPDLDGDCEADRLGSWDDGTWSFAATVQTNDCAAPPVLLPNYQFTTTYAITPTGCAQPTTCTMGVKQTSPACELASGAWSYVTDPSVHYHLKTSAGGGAIREGSLELFSADGKQVWTFTPTLDSYAAGGASGVVGGQWDYAEYKDDQWTVKNPTGG